MIVNTDGAARAAVGEECALAALEQRVVDGGRVRREHHRGQGWGRQVNVEVARSCPTTIEEVAWRLSTRW
jgi:hypothetical protein